MSTVSKILFRKTFFKKVSDYFFTSVRVRSK